MRAALLFILGGGLLWFVWHSVNGGAHAPDDVQAVSPGAMLAPEQPESSSAAPATAAEPPASTVAVEKSVITAPKKAPEVPLAPAKEVATPPAADPAALAAQAPQPSPHDPSATAAIELDLARELLLDPAHFEASIERRPSLVAPRRAFARAIARALNDDAAGAAQVMSEVAADPSIRASERDFVKALPGSAGPATTLASVGAESPLVLSASMILEARNASKLQEKGSVREAVLAYSRLLLEALDTPWHTDGAVLRRWTDQLLAVQKLYRWARAGAWPSVSVRVEPGDSWITVRKRVLKEHPDLLLCTGQLERANEMRGAVLQPGQTLRVPTDHAHMLVDLDSHWAFYLLGEEVVAGWEVGVGKESTQTKVGSFTVGDKKEEPMWFRPGKQPVPYGDPENPLGTRWIAWLRADGTTSGLGFHGTNEPASVGKELSQGCIRMLNQDVEELFEILPRGARIDVKP
jgi:hypothetical protein